MVTQSIDLGLGVSFLDQPSDHVIAVFHAVIDLRKPPAPARGWIYPYFHVILLTGRIITQYQTGNIDSKNNQSMSAPHTIKDALL